MGPRALTVYAVASPYAWDVVASAGRAGLRPTAVDNLGDADPRLPLGPGDPTADFVLGLSSAEGRVAAARAAFEAGFRTPVPLVDPTAVLAPTARAAHGAYVNAGVVVASHTEVGCHVNLNRSSSIGHDCRLEFGASIGPGAVLTGHVTVGAGAFVGAGATVLPRLAIGPGAVVGAGAVVTRDVTAGAVVVGNPAAEVRKRAVAQLSCPHCEGSLG